MRIGRLQITRLRRDPLGRKMHPWELVTMDQLTPDARQLIAKMARAAARDFLGDIHEDPERSTWSRLCQQIDSKVATSARDFFEDQGERFLSDLAPKLRHLIEEQLNDRLRDNGAKRDSKKDRPAVPVYGPCSSCQQPYEWPADWTQLPSGRWVHTYPSDCTVSEETKS